MSWISDRGCIFAGEESPGFTGQDAGNIPPYSYGKGGKAR